MNCKRFLPWMGILLLCSCRQNPHDIDVSGIQVTIRPEQFGTDLFSPGRNGLKTLREKYGTFPNLFCRQIIRIGAAGDSMLEKGLEDFSSDPGMRELYKNCAEKFSARDIDALADELSDAFRHYKYYFPRKPVPKVITFISGYNYAIVAADSLLGIGVDMYLGDDFRAYSALGYPRYKIRRMRKEYITADCMRGWQESEYEDDGKDFLSQALYQGKILYFLDAMLPRTPDSIKTGYTASQLAFCKKNEVNIWSFFVEKKILFSTNQNEFIRYLSDGPTTSGLPPEAPAMLGAWTGWQIIKKYMQENPSVTLDRLMEEKDSQKILNKSRYKPQKN